MAIDVSIFNMMSKAASPEPSTALKRAEGKGGEFGKILSSEKEARARSNERSDARPSDSRPNETLLDPKREPLGGNPRSAKRPYRSPETEPSNSGSPNERPITEKRPEPAVAGVEAGNRETYPPAAQEYKSLESASYTEDSAAGEVYGNTESSERGAEGTEQSGTYPLIEDEYGLNGYSRTQEAAIATSSTAAEEFYTDGTAVQATGTSEPIGLDGFAQLDRSLLELNGLETGAAITEQSVLPYGEGEAAQETGTGAAQNQQSLLLGNSYEGFESVDEAVAGQGAKTNTGGTAEKPEVIKGQSKEPATVSPEELPEKTNVESPEVLDALSVASSGLSDVSAVNAEEKGSMTGRVESVLEAEEQAYRINTADILEGSVAEPKGASFWDETAEGHETAGGAEINGAAADPLSETGSTVSVAPVDNSVASAAKLNEDFDTGSAESGASGATVPPGPALETEMKITAENLTRSAKGEAKQYEAVVSEPDTGSTEAEVTDLEHEAASPEETVASDETDKAVRSGKSSSKKGIANAVDRLRENRAEPDAGAVKRLVERAEAAEKVISNGNGNEVNAKAAEIADKAANNPGTGSSAESGLNKGRGLTGGNNFGGSFADNSGGEAGKGGFDTPQDFSALLAREGQLKNVTFTQTYSNATTGTSTAQGVEDTVKVYEKFSQAVKLSFLAGGKDVTLRLSPAHLGALQIKLQGDGNSVSAKILVDSVAVKNLLEGDAGKLKQLFAEQGLKMEEYTVDVKEQSVGTNDNRGAELWERHGDARDAREAGCNSGNEDLRETGHGAGVDNTVIHSATISAYGMGTKGGVDLFA